MMRDYIAAQTGVQTPDVLTCVTPAERPNPGPVLCACLNVGLNTIIDAIEGKGLMTVQALGEALGAGTDCGSCKPELAALLATHTLLEAAE